MKIPFVDLHAQYLTIKPEIDAAIADVIANSAYIRGPHVDKFEKLWAEALGVKHCVSCANGTDALYIAMRGLGIKPGDEVITTAHSWISTTETITQAGGKVVFTDTENDTFNHQCRADRIENHFAHGGNYSRASLRPAGGNGRDHGHRQKAQAVGDRRLRAGASGALQRQARRHFWQRGDVLVLSRKKSRRVWRRGRHRDERRSARRLVRHFRAARRQRRTHHGRHQQPHGRFAGRGFEREAAASAKVDRSPPQSRRALQRTAGRRRRYCYAQSRRPTAIMFITFTSSAQRSATR